MNLDNLYSQTEHSISWPTPEPEVGLLLGPKPDWSETVIVSSSNHPGGVNASFLGGSVGFIKNRITSGAWGR
jgi:prepilin-type processing-associated H-X9-DG protein